MTSKRSNKTGAHGQGARRPPEAERQAVYFLSLSLQDVRCFGAKQTLDLSDGKGRPARWTILLGNNGTGKTTVLQSLAAVAPVAVPDSVGIVPLFMMRWDAHPAYNFLRSGSRSPPQVKVTLTQRTALHALPEENRHYEVHYSFPCSEEASSDSYPTNQTVTWPVCYAYGAGRRLGVTSLRWPELDDATVSLFSDDVPLRNAEEWLLRLDYSASKASAIRKRQHERLQQVKCFLRKILPEVEGIRLTTPTESHPAPRVEFQTPYGWVPMRQLGYGYQTLIAWMVDFASRMVERYPDSPHPLAEPAVVLVDEIDLHLHPQWQRRLIGHLTEHFPNTQFIVTAHSPLVVQAAAGANIAVLRREGDHAVIDNDVQAIRGWRIDQIYTSELFGLESARPPELDEVLKRRREILSKPKLTKADERELRELEAQVGDLPVGETAEDIRTMKLLRESLDLIETARTQTP
jgi:hypothetical protein